MKIFGILSIAAILTMSSSSNDYYKPEYSDDNYYTILSSGTENEINEIWGVDKNDVEELPILDLKGIKFHKFEQKAKDHLEKRYEEITLTLLEIKLERITRDLINDRNWFVKITYQYHENGYIQMEPMLTDGRIILSTSE